MKNYKSIERGEDASYNLRNDKAKNHRSYQA